MPRRQAGLRRPQRGSEPATESWFGEESAFASSEALARALRAIAGDGAAVATPSLEPPPTALLGRAMPRSGFADHEQMDQLRARIRAVIEKGAVRAVYQPIVDLEQGRVSGVEALARFDTGAPARWFEDASDVGLGDELESLAATLALDGLTALPPGAYLSLNLSASALLSRRVCDLLRDSPLTRIVIEMTERVPVADHEGLRRALLPLREAGLRIAVDDAGAGPTSLRRILLLDPDIIKVDSALTWRIGGHTPERALSRALVAFAAETRATVVAEGIETSAQVQALRDLGVSHGQGFLLAPPAALPIDELGPPQVLAAGTVRPMWTMRFPIPPPAGVRGSRTAHG